MSRKVFIQAKDGNLLKNPFLTQHHGESSMDSGNGKPTTPVQAPADILYHGQAYNILLHPEDVINHLDEIDEIVGKVEHHAKEGWYNMCNRCNTYSTDHINILGNSAMARDLIKLLKRYFESDK